MVDTLPKVDYNRLVNQTEEVFKMGLSLKQIRLVREKTQDEMAEKLGVHVQTYRKLEENPDEVTMNFLAYLTMIFFLPSNSTKSRTRKRGAT